MATIPKNTFQFLNELSLNNNRDWFMTHKETFKSLEKEIKSSYNTLGQLMNEHDTIEKVKLFRIYRDVRFSNDKTPYKTHFGGSFMRRKPDLRGGYYVHLAPKDQSFIAVGFWEPSKDDLLRIRKEFEMDDREIRAIIKDKSFKEMWGEFVGEELKTAPKGFDKDHTAIDLIRKKQYIFTKSFKDKEVLSEGFLNTVNDHFKLVRPYFNYMSDVLTTDLNGVSII